VPTGTAPGVTTDPRVAPPRPIAAPRPVPPPPAPVPRVQPPPPAPPPPVSPLPPLNVSNPASRDELLESLELQPAAEMDDLLPEAPELGGMDPEGIPTDESEEIETVDLDQVIAAPPEPPPAAPQTEAQKAKTTLVSGPKETEDLRRRISRPQFPELSFDDVDQEDDIEELTFEPEVVSPTITAPPARVVPTPSQAVSKMETLPPGTRAVPPIARPEPPPSPVPVPAPRVLQETRNEVATVATPPVSVQLPGAHGQTDVSIPVEVTLGRGSAQVTVHQRLTLNLNLQP